MQINVINIMKLIICVDNVQVVLSRESIYMDKICIKSN